MLYYVGEYSVGIGQYRPISTFVAYRIMFNFINNIIMAKEKKLAAAEIDVAEVQAQINSLNNTKAALEAQKKDIEKRFPLFRDEQGNIIKRGPGHRYEELNEQVKNIDARLAELYKLC